jgi:ABC-type transport system involved in multi-copper enzyme maturation permease subunit
MGAPVTGALFQALGFTFLEMMVLTALAIFFSSTSTPILAAIFTFLLFGFGQLTGSLVDLGVLFRQSAPWVEKAMRAIYLFLPNLHNFNIRQEAVHAAGTGKFWAMSFHECATVAAYGVSYAAVLLLAAIFFFRKRNL